MPGPIVLFGGAFDPVHNGHLIAARAVAEQRGYGRVTLLPSARSPHKPEAAVSGAHRLAMLRLATAGEALFDVSDLELRRTGTSYTFDTLTALRKGLPDGAEIHLMIGADMLAELPTWHRSREVVELARIVVAMRPPWQERIEGVLSELAGHLTEGVVEKLGRSVVPTPLVDISSTDIRRRIAAGRSVRYLLPEAVREYIESHDLYRADDEEANESA